MPNTLITFNVEDRQARSAFSRLKREVDQLEDEFNTTRNEAREATEAIDRFADRSRIAAKEVDQLGDAAQQSATQVDQLGATAKRNNTVWQDTNSSLQDAHDRFFRAGQGAEFFTKSLSGANGILTNLGAALAAREMFEFGAASVQSAGKIEGLLRGLRAIEETQADSRLRDFNETAKLPGLNTPQIIRYSNSLRAAGATAAEVDAMITAFGQTIVRLDGPAADTSRAMLQLTHAFAENKISQENFSTIKGLIPNFNKLAQEVYNTDGSMDALNNRFQASGQTLGQFLLPILAKLQQEIPTAPVDSYAGSVYTLQEAFNQLQSAIGEKLLPVASKASSGFAESFDNITNFIQGTNDAKAALEAYTTALNTATAAGAVNKASQDRIASLQQEKAALEAAAEGHANYFRVSGRETDAGRRYKTITAELERLQLSTRNAASQSAYLRTEQARLATQAQALSTEIDQLNAKLRGRTPRTEPAEFARRSEAQAELAELQAQIATNANAERALASVSTSTAQVSIETATTNAENFGLALAKLKATAEDARETLQNTLNFQPVTPNFQAALAASNDYYDKRIAKAQEALEKEKQGTEAYSQLQAQIFELGRQRANAQRQLETDNQIPIPNFQQALAASNDYYNARIAKAQEALEKEKQGTDAYNQLQVQIFELGRQRIQAERQINVESQRFIQQLTQQRTDTATAASNAEVEAFQSAALAGQDYARQLENIATLSQRRDFADYVNPLAAQGQGFDAARLKAEAFFNSISQRRDFAIADYVNPLVAQGQGFDAARLKAEAFFKQIAAIPDAAGPDAASNNFTAQLRSDLEETERQGQGLLTVMREIASLSVGTTSIDIEERIPDPSVRQKQIDDQIAAHVHGAQTLETIRQDAAEQGRTFLRGILRDEQREIQQNINASARQYRQFANVVSNTFLDLATGRVQSFEQVATEFIRQSLRIALRALVEFQLQKRLDDTLTASKIANIQKVAAAQQVAGAGGLSNLAGLGNLSGLGRFGSALSGGGAALGVSALLFPQEARNLTGGITDAIGGLLSSVASIPDKAFSPQQIYLKIGDNEIKDITDIQRELVDENRL